MTNIINGIDVSEYFVNHYDSSGKLYAVEYKGNPLELQNSIKRLQEENEELKEENEQLKKPCLVMPKVNQLAVPIEKYEQLYKALEEIREKCLKMCNICDNIDGETYLDDCNSICEYCKIVKLIKEVTNEQK